MERAQNKLKEQEKQTTKKAPSNEYRKQCASSDKYECARELEYGRESVWHDAYAREKGIGTSARR